MFGGSSGLDPAKRHSSIVAGEKENAAGAGMSGYGETKRTKLNDNRTLKRNSTEPEDQRYNSKHTGAAGGGSGGSNNKVPLGMIPAHANIYSQMSNLSL